MYGGTIRFDVANTGSGRDREEGWPSESVSEGVGALKDHRNPRLASSPTVFQVTAQNAPARDSMYATAHRV